MNFIPCRIFSKEDHLFMGAGAFQLSIPEKKAPHYRLLIGSEAIFGIRPNDIYDRLYAPQRIWENTIRAVVEVMSPSAQRSTSM